MSIGRPKYTPSEEIKEPVLMGDNGPEELPFSLRAGRLVLAKRIGRILSEARLERRFTGADVAAAIRVNKNTLSTWENGHALPDVYSLFLLAQVLDLSMDVLAHGNEGAFALWYERISNEALEHGDPAILRPRDVYPDETESNDRDTVNSSLSQEVAELKEQMRELLARLPKE